MFQKYFTTPIYYASGLPHIGHLYTTSLMNILAQHYKNMGHQVVCLTGMDEHGEKIAKKATEAGVSAQHYVNNLAEKWQQSFQSMGITWDVFMRTTSPEHKLNVQSILTACKANGDIYFGEHEGHYCLDCEAFLTDKEMNENKECITHKTKTELRKEGNYYFRTSKYAQKIQELVRSGAIVIHKRYQQELLQMIQSMEGDLSISRPKQRTSWGIEIPFDTNHVTYVWFDALPNYVTGVGGFQKAKESELWKNTVHILGKDILKFHGFFWPAMCLSLGIPIPKLLVHGWLLQDGGKMSKSLGNVISPESFQEHGSDMFRNLVFRGHDLAEDLDLNMKNFIERYNADLANGIGNLLARTLGMVEKYFDKEIPTPSANLKIQGAEIILNDSKKLIQKIQNHFENYALHLVIEDSWKLIAETDKFISDSKPWELAKHESEKNNLSDVLSVSCQALRTLGICLHSFFPEKMSQMLCSLGIEKINFQEVSAFLNSPKAHIFQEVPKLYLRLDIQQELAKFNEKKPVKEENKNNVVQSVVKPNEEIIEISDFQKTKIRVGTILTAEAVEGSDKLLRLVISLGSFGERNILSGIKQWNKPEEVVNKKVGIVSNLKPRKMKFGMSEGMLLSQELEGGKIVPLFLDDAAIEGTEIC
jgi:methionyl-tRNA synthetase